MIARAGFSLAALVVLAVAPLRAQEVRRDTTPLAPVVVTATRTSEPVATLGNSVTVLQGDDLRRAGITSVSEALRAVQGVSVVQQSSYGSVTSLFVRGGQSTYLRVLVDGVPINQPGGALDLSDITMINVERIELVRGPSSVLYGSDAVTGVLQIFTRAGSGGARLRAQARGGSYGSTDFDAELSAGGATVGGTLAAARTGTDGIYDFNSQYHNTTGSGALWFRPDARTDARVSARYHDGALHYPTEGSGAPLDSNAFQMGRGTTVSLDAGRYLSPRLELRALLGFNESRDSIDDAPDDALDFPFYSHALTDRRNADVRMNLHRGAGTTWTLGASVEEERERSSNNFSPGLTSIARTNRALYAQAVGPLGPRLTAQAGVRLDDNQAFGTFVTFRVGGSARVAERTRLRATIGSAFKEPTFIENYSSGFAVGNDSLQPEHSLSWELGVEQTLSRGLTLSGGYYHQRFRDMIQFTFAPPTLGDPNFYNIAGVNVWGVEIGADWTVSPAFRLRAEYTGLHTSVTDSGYGSLEFTPGEPLIRRPAHSGSLSADLTPPGRFTGGGRVLVVGRRDDLDFSSGPPGRVTLPEYVRLDLWGEVALVRGRSDLALTARVENATDTWYQEVSGYAAPGVRVLLGARIDAGR